MEPERFEMLFQDNDGKLQSAEVNPLTEVKQLKLDNVKT